MIDIDNQYTFYRHIILTVMLQIKMWIKYSFSRHKVSVYLIDLYLRLQSVRYVTCFQSLPLPVDARMMVVTAGLSASYCPQDRSVSLISGTRRVRVTGGGVTPAPAPSCSLPPPPPHLRPVSGVKKGLKSSFSHWKAANIDFLHANWLYNIQRAAITLDLIMCCNLGGGNLLRCLIS